MDNQIYTDPMDGPMFSRTEASDVFGKLDAEVQAIRIDSDTLIKLHAEANAVGMTLSEFCRVVLRGRVWGADHVATIGMQRIRRAMGNAGTLQGSAQ